MSCGEGRLRCRRVARKHSKTREEEVYAHALLGEEHQRVQRGVMRDARRHFYHHRRFLGILPRCFQVMLGELERCQRCRRKSAYVSIRQHTSA